MMFRLTLTSLCLISLFLTSSNADDVDIWIGTASHPTARGIYHAVLDTDTGGLSQPELAAEIRGCGFLALHPSGTTLYAVGDAAARVTAFRVEHHDDAPSLTRLNSIGTGDGGACHVAVDATGSMLMTAQYGGGSTSVFAIDDDGSIGERTAVIEHATLSGAADGARPHAHYVGFSPDNRFALVPDLGLNAVVTFAMDPENAIATFANKTAPIEGSGPRHLKFHPDGNTVWVLNERDVSVTTFDYQTGGSLQPKSTTAMVPAADLANERRNSGSEIVVDSSGRFVYAATRGHDVITVLAVQPDRSLTVVEREPIRGATPRNFNLDPTGRWLLAAGQDSHTVAVFEVDSQTGELTYHRQIVQVPAPICVLPVPR